MCTEVQDRRRNRVTEETEVGEVGREALRSTKRRGRRSTRDVMTAVVKTGKLATHGRVEEGCRVGGV